MRTAGLVEGLTAAMQRALAGADPNLPTSDFYGMKDLQARTLATQRIEAALLGAMAGLALLLSTVVIFALVANLVAHGTRKIGIRMALGSIVSQVMLQIVRSGAGASLLGVLVGLAVSAATLRVMRSLLYGVDVYERSPTQMESSDLPGIRVVVSARLVQYLVSIVALAVVISGCEYAVAREFLRHADLHAWYVEINVREFQGRLPDANVSWGGLSHGWLRSTRRYSNGSFEMALDPNTVTTEREARDTLCHEACHVATWTEPEVHGAQWQSCMENLKNPAGSAP